MLPTTLVISIISSTAQPSTVGAAHEQELGGLRGQAAEHGLSRTSLAKLDCRPASCNVCNHARWACCSEWVATNDLCDKCVGMLGNCEGDEQPASRTSQCKMPIDRGGDVGLVCGPKLPPGYESPWGNFAQKGTRNWFLVVSEGNLVPGSV